MSRLSRKEVKRDEVLETVGSAVHYARDHSRTILWAVVAVAVLAVGYAVFTIWSSGRSAGANESLAEALAVLEAQIDPYDPRPDGDPPKFADEAARAAKARQAFEAVRRSHGGSEPAVVAAAYLARMAAEAGETDRARELWTEVAERGSDNLLAAEARVNLMALEREAGRLEELADDLRRQLDQPDAALPQPVLLQQLALTLEGLDRGEEAREVYLRLAEEHPTSAFAASAQRRAQEL